jgi:TolA-binding protein
MSAFGCEEARRWLEARSDGSLGDDEASALDVHLAICSDCQGHVGLLDAIESTLRDGPLPGLTAEMEARFLSGQPSRARRSTLVWPAVAVAAAAVLVFSLRPAPEATPSVPATAVATSVLAVEEPVEALPEAPPELVAGAADGTALYLTSDAVIATQSNGAREAHFVLERGSAVAVVGANEPGFRFRVETATSIVTATGTIFSVQVWADGRERYRVLEGSVEVAEKGSDDPPIALEAGFDLEPGMRSPRRSAAAAMHADLGLARWQDRPAEMYVGELNRRLGLEAAARTPEAVEVVRKPAKTAKAARSLDELYRAARKHQLSRDFDAATAAHEEIVRSHPDDRGAWLSHVALGQMRLQVGQATASLEHFGRYLELAPEGTLAEEARFGRVGAARELGRSEDVVAWATDYLSEHPNTVGGAEVLRARADAHRASGERARAEGDYRAIIAAWPDTSQATHAHVALAGGASAP